MLHIFQENYENAEKDLIKLIHLTEDSGLNEYSRLLRLTRKCVYYANRAVAGFLLSS
jgi:ribosomal protein L32